MHSGPRSRDARLGLLALAALTPLVWSLFVARPATVPSLPLQADGDIGRLVLTANRPAVHMESAPGVVEDGSADPVQLEAVAIGVEAASLGTSLKPAVLLAVRDGIVPDPASRFPQLPPRPPPAA